LIPHPYSNNLVHRQERRFARQRYLIFDTLRTRTTTLDELNEDEPGNADAPPHHHGKLTTRTTTRRRRGGAQGNRRTRRRRGRHHRLGTRVRAEDDDSKHLDMELLHRNHGNRAATLGRGGGRYDLRRQEQVAATGCAGCDERRRLCCETRTEQQTGERRRRRTAQALVRRSYCTGRRPPRQEVVDGAYGRDRRLRGLGAATATSVELRNTARVERSSDGWRRRVVGPGAHTLTLLQQERRDPERLRHRVPAAERAGCGERVGRRRHGTEMRARASLAARRAACDGGP
jgi:hypothetical protein